MDLLGGTGGGGGGEDSESTMEPRQSEEFCRKK